MSLIPKHLAEQIPSIGSDSETPMRETLLQVRFFDRDSSWQWFVVEYDGEDTCFGLILSNSAAVAGQFTLTELENLCVCLDERFQPLSVGDLAVAEPLVKDFLREPVPREAEAGARLVQLEVDDL